MKIYRIEILRKVLLPIFNRFNLGDITIRHHWVPVKIKLHSFKHKGYWWHGKRREEETINKFYKLINPGDTVLEVGGHIGYFSVIFSSLVGKKGNLTVFEPGENNLTYIEDNLRDLRNTNLIKKAISDVNGTVKFYLENLTGQNNSIIKDYQFLENNIQHSGIDNIKIKTVEIPSITIDKFAQESVKNNIDFIKIDIEGAELLALRGAKDVLKNHKPNMMIEVTSDSRSIFEILTSFQYKLFTPSGKNITDPDGLFGNIFCLTPEKEKLFYK